MATSLTRDNIRHMAYKCLDDLQWLETHVTYREGRARDLKLMEFKFRDLKKRMLKMIDTFIRDQSPDALQSPQPPQSDEECGSPATHPST